MNTKKPPTLYQKTPRSGAKCTKKTPQNVPESSLRGRVGTFLGLYGGFWVHFGGFFGFWREVFWYILRFFWYISRGFMVSFLGGFWYN